MRLKTLIFGALAAAVLSAAATAQTRPDAAATEFRAHAVDLLARSGVPGMALAVVKGDGVLLAEGFGVRHLGEPAPVTPRTVFPIASLSKAFVSATIAGLVGDGVLGWDDRLADRLPGFRLFDPFASQEMTLRDALAQRSGLREFAGSDLEEVFGYDAEEVLHRLRYLRPIAGFRTQFSYQNWLIMAVAMAAERATGQDWPELLRRRLLEPLGMTATGVRHADYEAAANRAGPHALDGDPADRVWIPGTPTNRDGHAATGGMSASLEDLIRWTRFQLGDGTLDGRRVLTADNLKTTHRRHTITGEDDPWGPSAYGLCWNVVSSRAGIVLNHEGAVADGVQALIVLVPEQRLGLVVLTNGIMSGLVGALETRFMDLFLFDRHDRDPWPEAHAGAIATVREYKNPPAALPESAPDDALPRLPLARYAGIFATDYHGAIAVTAAEDALVLRFGAQGQRHTLAHWSGHVFRDETDGSAVTFTVDRDGQAIQVIVEALNPAVGEGVFTRRTDSPPG